MSTSVDNTRKRKKACASNDKDSQHDMKQVDQHSLKLFGEGDSYQQVSVFSPKESIDILKELDEQVVYLPRAEFKFRIFHTVNLLPRDKAFYGDVETDGSYPLYRYESGKDVVYPEVKPWPSVLERLRDKIFEITDQRCNHCVVNQYRDNNDHIGYHFDKAADFVNRSSVISLTFGGERILRLKHMKNKTTEDVPQKAGSLFLLGWSANSIWKHSIVKTKRACERRVSLTYRLIKTIKHPDGTLTTINGSNFLSKETPVDHSNATKKMKIHKESE